MRLKNSCGIFSVLARVMGCFFDCFRVRDNNKQKQKQKQKRNRFQHNPNPRIVSDSVPTKEGPAIRNQLSSLLLSGDEADVLVVKDRENLIRRSTWSESENDDRELRDEAKFLKACGTLQETPAEIRKLSKKLKDSRPNDPKTEASNFHSWLPDTSTSVLIDGDKQLDESINSSNQREESRTYEVSETNFSPISCVLNKEDGIPDFISSQGNHGEPQVSGISETAESSVSTATPVSKKQTHKSVRFESEPVLSKSSPQVRGPDEEKLELAGNKSAKIRSPCPTPLKLTDEMQTPGTVFATNLGTRTNARIISQYVHTAPYPPKGLADGSVLEQDGATMPLSSITDKEADDQQENHASKSEVNQEETSANKELKADLGSSDWLKPPKDSPGAARPRVSNHGDRPILGLVAAHWKEDELLPRVSPKGVTGNGIPNSTTKYKEDQKVSWHATPFEVRLEKALSEEGGINCPRNVMRGTPIAFEEPDSEATTPHPQSLSCP
ncbi:hypothetical protein Droror1_Dr00019606 [Drosera rotundifolia]